MLAALGGMAAAASVIAPQVSEYVHLAGQAQQAVGAVQRVTTADHGTVYYTFIVAGIEYDGNSFAGPPNPPARSLTPGEAIVVYYDPQDPQRSVAVDPGAQTASAWKFVIAGGLIAAVVGGLNFLDKCRGRGRGKPT
ncbi:MAG TPA: DUF3592 domain-containing protein [Kineosporiaceae bacterium]|nr:DUF3592 domain-containing protein [Kineosporiaceae bacterium]